MRNRAKIIQISVLESGDIQRLLCIGVTGMQKIQQFGGIYWDQQRLGNSAEKDAGHAFQGADYLEPLSSVGWRSLGGDAH